MTRTRDEKRHRAREWQARDLKTHYEKQGKQVSYEQCYREACQRGDRCDAKTDRNIKE